jgi:predicted nucleic acid-binding protein
VQFVDTTVLLYAISRDPAEQDKAKQANDILAGRDLALSVQVLQEFYVQATRASRPDPITHQQAVRLIESFRRFPVQDITSAILTAALDTRQRFQLSYWDSAIIEASRAMGCAEVLSEDLGDGQDYAGVRVTNPFHRPELTSAFTPGPSASPMNSSGTSVPVEQAVLGVPVPLGGQQARPVGTRDMAADQEDVGFLAGLQDAQLGVHRRQVGDQPLRVRPGAPLSSAGS